MGVGGEERGARGCGKRVVEDVEYSCFIIAYLDLSWPHVALHQALRFNFGVALPSCELTTRLATALGPRQEHQ